MNDLITVVVPIYNSIVYLEKCVDSILQQTYTKKEIMLIDDGSTDGSASLCDEISKREECIKVVHKKNGGVSSARNVGIENASGKYICFVDSDDTLEKDALEKLYTSLNETEADFVIGFLKYDNRKTNIPIKFNEIVNVDKDPLKLLDILVRKNSYSSCGKLYKLEIIKSNNLFFNEFQKCSEDTVFIRKYILFCKKIVTIPYVVYKVDRSNLNSASKKGYIEYAENRIYKLRALQDICDSLSISNKQSKEFINYRTIHSLRISVFHYLNCWNNDNERKELIIKSVQILKEWIDFEEETNRFMDIELEKWWKNKKSLVLGNQYDKFYSLVEKEYKRSVFLKKIKNILKRIVR